MKRSLLFIECLTISLFVYSQETPTVIKSKAVTNLEQMLGVAFVNATQTEIDDLNKLNKKSFVGALKVISRREKAHKISAEVIEGDMLIEYYTTEGLNAKRFPILNKKDFFNALLSYKIINKKEVRLTTPFGKPGFHTLYIYLSKITLEQIQEDISKMKDE